jgi:hypothetical protein
MSVRSMSEIRPGLIATACFLTCLFFMSMAESAGAFDFNNTLENAAAVGAAYVTNLYLHELGHQVVANEVGADSPKIAFFTRNNGKFFAGLATYKSIPEESKLPYALGGERMEGFTFEYALECYHHNPTTFNKALMFFSATDFLANTLVANYVFPDHKMCDQNVIRSETGCSKEFLLSLALAKSLLNAYRVMNPDATFIPLISLDKYSAVLELRFEF